MKFSFNKTPTKPKTSNVFQTALQPTQDNGTKQNDEKEENKMNTDQPKTNNNKKPFKFSNNDSNLVEYPCTMFKQQYNIAISCAQNGNFPESLRKFDLAIRFWGIHLEHLQLIYPSQYKTFKIPDINSCDASNYFLNLYKRNKDKNNKKTKKKLWKPPPKHQPQQPESNPQIDDDDDDEEIIYFDDDDDDVDLIEEKTNNNDNKMDIKEWEQMVVTHRNIGSEMFEYHAQVLLEMDRDFDAIKACQSAILLNDMNGVNWLTLSRAELNFGDPFQGLKSISRAIELDFENDEIIEQYSNIYTICNKLTEMKQNGKMTDDVLKRRLMTKSKGNTCECESDVELTKRRLKKRGNTADHIGRMNSKTDVQQIVEDYQKIVKMTKKLNVVDTK